jgi:hypothetical protein
MPSPEKIRCQRYFGFCRDSLRSAAASFVVGMKILIPGRHEERVCRNKLGHALRQFLFPRFDAAVWKTKPDYFFAGDAEASRSSFLFELSDGS